MWYDTRAAKILGAQYPILQGPFGGNLSTVKLLAAVSNLGGVGGYGAFGFNQNQIIKLNEDIREATDKPYNINLWVSGSDIPEGKNLDDEYRSACELFKPYFDELGVPLPEKPVLASTAFENQVDAILHARPPVFSFVMGIPDATVLEQCRKLNIVTVGAATTIDEAIALEEACVDLIIASGFEAGGHRPSFLAPPESSLVGTFVLVQQIREKVRTPVVAAGGIANAKGIAAAMTLGAEAVQIGTAFLACEESNASDIQRNMLFADASKYTILTKAFSGRLGRGLQTRIATDVAGKEKSLLPFPLQSQFAASLSQAANSQGKRDLLHCWSGQIAPIIKHKKAGELMQALISETSNHFYR